MNVRNTNTRSLAEVAGGEQEVRQLLEAAGRRPEVPARDMALIRSAARLEWRQLVESRPSRWYARPSAQLAFAASLLLALAAGWWWLRARPPLPAETVATVDQVRGDSDATGTPGAVGGGAALAVGDSLTAGTELATADRAGGPPTLLAVRLSGGQSVRLDAGSRIRLRTGTSLELVRGAVYVDSGAAGGAVEVTTPLGKVRDVGTQFEVRLSNGGEAALRVRVRQGSVSVRRGTEAHSAVAGEELTLRPGAAPGRMPLEPYGPTWDWVQAAAPNFDIEGLALSAYLGWVSRETGWQVRYEDEALAASAAAISLHGTIEGLTPAESVGVILPGSGLDHRLEAGTLLVLRPAGGRS